MAISTQQEAGRSAVAPQAAEQSCPACGAAVPVNPGYVTWCECGWNLHPQTPEEVQLNRFDRFVLQLSRKHSARLFAEMKRGRSLKPSLTLGKLGAYLIATVVHLLSLGVLAAGVWFLIAGVTMNGMFWLYSAICLGFAWLLRPRLPRLSKQAAKDEVTREEYPVLFRMLDEMSDVLNTRRVEKALVNEEFTAFFTQTGWRQRKVVGIGLPLFEILTPQEKVAVLAHELAHGANGDVRRSFYIGSAIGSLVQWYFVVRPESLWAEDSGWVGFLMIPFAALMYGVSWLLYGVILLLEMLIYADSQRAEYLADYLASTVCGTEAMKSALGKLHGGAVFVHQLQRAYLNKSMETFFRDFKEEATTLPQRERERIERVEMMEQSRLDVTHPPTKHRIEFLDHAVVDKEQYRLTSVDAAKLDKELSRLHGKMQERLRELYQSSLYA